MTAHYLSPATPSVPVSMTASPSLDTVFDVLADSRHRFVLSCLLDHDGPLSVRELATAAAARERNTTEEGVPDGARDAMLVTLRHWHLPQLDSEEFVTYDPEDAAVALSDHPMLDEPWVTDLIVDGPETPSHTRDGVLDALASARRRTVLSVLADHDGAVSVSGLAARVAAREDEKSPPEVTEHERADVLTTLHHVHLPKLAGADLIEHDGSEETVVLRDVTELRTEWLDDSPVSGSITI